MDKALIDRLVEKATVTKMDLTWGQSSEFNKELFAELIVKELVAVLDARDPDFNDYSKRVVKQHFGVNV